MKHNKIFAVLTVLVLICSVFAANCEVFAEAVNSDLESVAADGIEAELSSDVTEDTDTETENAADDGADESDNGDKAVNFKICVPEFIDSLKVMLIGMLGIFAVTGVIIVCICILNKLTKTQN